MRFSIRSVATRFLLAHIAWHRLLVITVFLLTLVFTIRIGDLVISLVSPAKADAPAAVMPMVSEITKAPATVESESRPTLPTWDHTDRVNILLMGLDGFSNQGRLRRADSLIVASIDPATNTAALISIPRDLYVTINSPKGAIRNRINTAYVWGEMYNYPGGGPALQMRTVSEALGLPIHHYIELYFDGFAKLIVAIGGVDIDVQQALNDPHTGATFSAGMQHMDGWRALEFARSRYSTSDFSRGRRQQQIILAAVDKMTKTDILPKLPAVLPVIGGAFRSDMSIPDLMALASLGYKIDRSKIKMAQIDETMCQNWRAPDGAAVLLPTLDRIKQMVQAATAPPATLASVQSTPVSTAVGASTSAAPAIVAPPTLVPVAVPSLGPDHYAEQAAVEILNGTETPRLASRAQFWLRNRGFNVIRIADAAGIYKQTVLYDDGAMPATRDALIRLLNVQPQNIKSFGAGGVNIRIVLGEDATVP